MNSKLLTFTFPAIATTIQKKYCSYCFCLFSPGENCSVRLNSLRRSSTRKRLKKRSLTKGHQVIVHNQQNIWTFHFWWKTSFFPLVDHPLQNLRTSNRLCRWRTTTTSKRKIRTKTNCQTSLKIYSSRRKQTHIQNQSNLQTKITFTSDKAKKLITGYSSTLGKAIQTVMTNPKSKHLFFFFVGNFIAHSIIAMFTA